MPSTPSRFGGGRFFALAALLVIVNVTGLIWIRAALTRSDTTLWIDAVSPTTIDAARRIRFTFGSEAIPADRAGSDLEIAPFDVTPPLEGRWVWASTHELDLELTEPPRAGCTFRFEARSALDDQVVHPVVGRRSFEFETRALTVERLQLRRIEDERAVVTLRFDQPVAPDALEAALTVESPEGEAIVPSLEMDEPTTELDFRVPIAGRTGFRVRLAPGLHGFGATRGLAAEVERYVALPIGLAVDDVSASRPEFDGTARVAISLNRRLDFQQPLEAVEVEPPVVGLTRSVHYDDVVLHGVFRPGERYTITLPVGLRARDGSTLGKGVTRSIEIPDPAPAVSFPLGRGQLSSSGHRALEFDTVGVESVRFSAWRVHANNIVPLLRGEEQAATSRALATHRWVNDAEPKRIRHERLDLHELLGDRVGVYQLEAAAEGHRWVRDHAQVTVSDLGLSVRRGVIGTDRRPEEEWCVWVTSVERGAPLEDVELELRSYSDQVLARGRTETDGTCRLHTVDDPDGAPFVLIAARGDDLNYLPVSRAPAVLDHVETSGRPWPASYDALLYAERGIVQPGETFHVTGVIRTAAGEVPEPFPLELRVARPDGREQGRLVATPVVDGQGFVQFDVPTRAGEMTGPHRLTLHLPGSVEVLGETEVLVEPFVPPRLEVAVKGPAGFGTEAPLAFDVQAHYLFGLPASGLRCDGVAWLRPRRFRSPRLSEFTFEPADARVARELRVPVASLDEQGRLELIVPRPDDLAPGPWSLQVSAEVQEPGARTVSGFAEARLDHASRIVGLSLPDAQSWRTGREHRVRYAITTLTDEPAEAPALTFELFRIVRDYRLEQVDGRVVWRSIEERVGIDSGEIRDAGSSGSFALEVAAVGEYRLVVTDPETGWSTAATFHATLSGELSSAVAVRAPERVELRVEPAVAAPGQTVQVIVKSPFPGRLFLTLEDRSLIEARVIELPDGHADVPLTLPSSWRGTAFVAATVVRGLAGERGGVVPQWSPHRALGLARIDLDPSAHRFDVELDAPPEARPGASLTVTATVPSVDATRPLPWVHVWAIDEGIRLATDFALPDPLDHFLAPREARYRTLDAHGDLLPDLDPPSSLAFIGGDRERAERLRRLAADVPRRVSGVIWQAAVPVGEDGRAVFEVTAPERSGTLRFFAVAAAGDTYGAMTMTTRLTAPLLVEASAPRVVAPGDRFELRAKVFNQTGDPMTARVTVRCDGPLVLQSADDESHEITIAAGGTSSIALPVEATAPGTIGVRFVVDAGVTSAEDRVTARCRAADTLAHEAVLERLEAGSVATIDLEQRYRADTVRGRLRISASPTVELVPVVRELVDYPHGCAEQTTSRLLPLITLDGLLREGRIGVTECGFTPEDIAARIEAGVRRLVQLQSRDGGLSYWGGGDSSVWISTYATLALLEARGLSHAIPEDLLDGLIGYLETRLAMQSIEPDLDAFIGRVLAAADRPQESRLVRLNERRSELDLAGTAHLIEAWRIIGEPARARELLDPDLLAVSVPLCASGRITSPSTQEAFLLEAVLALDPRHEWVPVLSERLIASRQRRGWGNTLASATAFRALARTYRTTLEVADFHGRARIGEEWRSFDSEQALVCDVGPGPWTIESEGVGTISV
ncbi:MAG: hypothetical protein KDC38_05555, partial [Planctomycetes bacterium]|nr:hypothetical protein [Planctomycetota bacterium]